MKPSQFSKIGLLALVVGFTALSACTSKKRPKQIAQGQGRDLHSVSDYDGKEFDLVTGGVVATTSDKSVKKLRVKNEMGLEVFDLVTYQTSAKLLPKNLDFRGRPAHSYKIAYQVTDQYLKVLKLAKKQDLDFSELTYAKPYSADLYSVPLLGYPIQHIRLEQARNSDNEETNVTIEIPVQTRSEGSHIRFNTGRYVRFEALSKNDVYPASLFEFEDENSVWYYKQTIVSATGRYEGYKGLWNNTDSDGFFTSKVRFIKAGSNSIQVISNEKASGYASDKIHNGLVLSIPADFLDYKISENGGEEGLSQTVDMSGHWEDRKYVRLALSNLTTVNGINGGQVQEVQITDDYFSVVIQHIEQDSRVRMRYSFLKVPKKNNFVPRVAFKEDLKKFGILNRPKKTIFFGSYNQQQVSDMEDQFVLTRFNPNKPVVFHISETTKHKYRPIIHRAKDIWNEFLIRSGSKLRIAIAHDIGQLGDLRQNQIAIEESVMHSGWSGVSTSVVDSDTGEIISTIAQGQANTIKWGIYNSVLSVVRNKLGLTPGVVGAVNFQATENSSSLLSYAKKLGLKEYYTHDAKGSIKPVKLSDEVLNSKNISLKEKIKSSHSDFKCEAQSVGGAMEEQIEKYCSDDSLGGSGFESYLDSVDKNNLSKSLEIDKNFLERCSEKILMEGPGLLSTMVHEIGHSIGLDHNFMGSMDREHFYQKGEIPEHYDLPQTSSIMDYFRMSQERGYIPGKYDLAALKYLYDEKIELDSGEFKTIKTKLSLNQQGLSRSAIKYNYCNDEDANSLLIPGCFRFDSGSTPFEITKDIIEKIRESRIASAYRYSGLYINSFPTNLSAYIELKTIYDEYRNRLAKLIGYPNAKLHNYSLDQFKKLPEDWMKQKDPQLESYHLASEEIKKFFLDEGAFLLNKYCLFKSENHEKTFVSETSNALARLANIESCNSNSMNEDVEIKEVGFSLFPGFFNHSSYKQQGEQFDFSGFYLERLYAIIVMSQSTSFNRELSSRDIHVSMVDDPVFREKVDNKFLSRVLEGVEIPGVESRHPIFSTEKGLLVEMMRLYKGLSFTGSTIAQNMRRESSFGLSVSSSEIYKKMIVADLYDFTEQGQFVFGVRDPKYTKALKLVRQHKFLNSVLSVDKLNESVVNGVREAIKLLPTEENVSKELTLRHIKSFYDVIAKLEIEKTDDSILIIKQFFDNRFGEAYEHFTSMYRRYFKSLDALQAEQLDYQKQNGQLSATIASDIAQLKNQNTIAFKTPVIGDNEMLDKAYMLFNQKNLEQSLNDGLAQFESARVKAQDYPLEIEAQKDLLVETMLLHGTSN